MRSVWLLCLLFISSQASAPRILRRALTSTRQIPSLEWTIDALKIENKQLRQVHQGLSNFSYGMTLGSGKLELFRPVFVPPVTEPAVPPLTNQENKLKYKDLLQAENDDLRKVIQGQSGLVSGITISGEMGFFIPMHVPNVPRISQEEKPKDPSEDTKAVLVGVVGAIALVSVVLGRFLI